MTGRRLSRELLARLSREAPLVPGAEVLAFVDVDSTQKRVYGRKKEGTKFGHTKTQGKSVLVRGLNALIAAVSTPAVRASGRRHEAARRETPLPPVSRSNIELRGLIWVTRRGGIR